MKILRSPSILLFWTLLALAVPNVVLSHTEQLPPLAAATNILLPVALYGLIISASRRTGRQVWWLFPFIFMAAFNVVLLFLWGNSIIGVDMFLNLVTTNPSEALELLDNLLSGIAAVILLYAMPLVMAAVQAFRRDCAPEKLVRRIRKYSAAIGVAGTVSLLASIATLPDYRATDDLFPLNVFYNVKLAAERTLATARYDETAADFRFDARPTHPADERELYILVIGETTRAASLQLYGYQRNTTPHLAADTTHFVAFTDVLSQSNTTHKSVPMLLAPVSAEDYDSIYHRRSIITAFREAGFHTAVLSNQRQNHSFIDIFSEEAHETIYIKNDGTEHHDADLLPHVRRIIDRQRTKQLIVLHLYGSHFNYRERYPQTLAPFQPDTPTDAKPANKASLTNAYDNTVYATDHLLQQLGNIATSSRASAAILYTSDHGENLYDDHRKLFLHASPRPSYYELHVPFILYLSDNYRRTHHDEAATLKDHAHQPAASSATLFHTMLHIAGIQTPIRTDTLSLASPAYHCQRRSYLNDHNKAVPLTTLHLDDEDIRQFQQRQLLYP